jgi:hypothetical protein
MLDGIESIDTFLPVEKYEHKADFARDCRISGLEAGSEVDSLGGATVAVEAGQPQEI